MKKYQKPLFLLAFLLIVLFPPARSGAFCALIALCVGRLAAVPLAAMEQRGCPRWLGGVFLMLGISALVIFMVLSIFSRLCDGVTLLTEEFPDFSALFQRLEEASSSLEGSVGTVAHEVILLLSQQNERLPTLFASLAGKASKWVASALPQKLFFFFITLLASYYAAVDWPQIRQLLNQAVPPDWEKQMQKLLRSLAAGGKNWLRVQGRLVLMQFFLLSVGFLLLKVASPLFAGFITAFADALPLLGTGSILAPWALLLALMGQSRRALGMTALWFFSWVLRAVLEPRLVGHQAGISPFFTVLGMYLGLRCFGVVGMMAGAVLISTVGSFKTTS